MAEEPTLDYSRELEDACLSLWDFLCDDDLAQIQEDSPDLIDFVKRVRDNWWGVHNVKEGSKKYE